MTRVAAGNDGLDSGFRREVKEKTLTTARYAGLIAVVAFPAWAGFDYLVEPGNADDFALLRLAFDVPMLALFAALFTRLGRRYPELLMLGILCLVEISIAIMVSRVEEQFAAYSLGMSLALYASAVFLIWSWRYTAALVGISLVTLAIAIAVAPVPLEDASIATIAFYVGTAALLALVAQVLRERLARSEFESRFALEREQERSRDLLKKLERLSREDPLTGLANRRSWDDSLEREFARAVRSGLPLAVLIADIDRFKDVNDRCGHAIGDRVLETVAGVLMRRVRTGDLVARIGGDEFAILCADTDLEGAAALAESLRRRIEGTDFPERPDDVTTISIGVAAIEAGDDGPRDAMLRADECLYEAKRRRNAVCSSEPAAGSRPEMLTEPSASRPATGT